MDHSAEILTEVRSLSSVLMALLEALKPEEGETDSVTSLAETLREVGQALDRQASAVEALQQEVHQLKRQVGASMREPA